MKRRVWFIASTVVLVVLAVYIAAVSVIARSSQLNAVSISPREVLRIPWGTTSDTVAYRTVQADGWQGPSTIAVDKDSVYVVDRVNCEIKVCGKNGKIVDRIPLPAQYAKCPYQLEIVGNSLFLTHDDIGQPMGLAMYRNGQWSDVNLDKSIPGFSGWLHLSSTAFGRLNIRRDIPPEEDDGSIPRWAVLDESGTVISSTLPVFASPDDNFPEPQLITNETGRQSLAPAGQEIGLVNRAGKILKRAVIENGAATNVITMLKDRTQDVFVRTRTLTGELDRWTNYLTVYGPNLEVRARVALVLPDQYRDSFVFPSSDVGRTDIVANDKYYEMVYLKDGIVVLEWDPFARK